MSNKKSYIGIKNETSSNTLELHFTDYIYDGIDWNTWEQINMVQDTIDAIKTANPTTIKIIINSLGGDVMIGLALYNYLKSYNATKEVEIIGFAASIASVMAMCASPGKLRMAKNSFMIIHAAWSYASGNADEIREQADSLEKVSNELADIYAQRSGKQASDFTKMWAGGDKWLTGTEAKELGLVDELTNAEAVINASLDFNAHGFKHVPAALMQASVVTTPQNFFTQIKDEFMKVIDSLKAAVTGGKENTATAAISNKQEILDMVEAVLTPFAEAVDKAIEEVKKPAETTEVKEPVETPEIVEETTTTATPAPSKEEAEKPKDEVAELRAEVKRMSAAMAAMATKPAPAASTEEDMAGKVNIEHE